MPLVTVRRGRPAAIGRCRGPHCGRAIEWVETATGMRMPIDAPLRVVDICDDGTVRIEADASHWATCIDATEFRQGR